MGREGRLLLCQSSVRVSREVLLVDFCTGGQGRFVAVDEG